MKAFTPRGNGSNGDRQWSPDCCAVAFGHWPRPETNSGPACYVSYAVTLWSETRDRVITRVGRSHDWRQRLRDHQSDYRGRILQHSDFYDNVSRIADFPLIGLVNEDIEDELHVRFAEASLGASEEFDLSDDLENWIEDHRLARVTTPWPICRPEWLEWQERTRVARIANDQYGRLVRLVAVLTTFDGAGKQRSEWPRSWPLWGRPESILYELEQLEEPLKHMWGAAEAMRDEQGEDVIWAAPWELHDALEWSRNRWAMWEKWALNAHIIGPWPKGRLAAFDLSQKEGEP